MGKEKNRVCPLEDGEACSTSRFATFESYLSRGGSGPERFALCVVNTLLAPFDCAFDVISRHYMACGVAGFFVAGALYAILHQRMSDAFDEVSGGCVLLSYEWHHRSELPRNFWGDFYRYKVASPELDRWQLGSTWTNTSLANQTFSYTSDYVQFKREKAGENAAKARPSQARGDWIPCWAPKRGVEREELPKLPERQARYDCGDASCVKVNDPKLDANRALTMAVVFFSLGLASFGILAFLVVKAKDLGSCAIGLLPPPRVPFTVANIAQLLGCPRPTCRMRPAAFSVV